MVYCGNCGCKNPDINRFCLNCGAQLFYSFEEYLDANGQPHTGEIERIGSGASNNGFVPPVPAPAPEPQVQAYQQNRPPENAPYQQPPVAAPVYTGAYQQPNNMYGGYQQQQAQEPRRKRFAMAPPEASRKKMEILDGCPNNNINFRYIGMGLAIVAFIILIVGMTVVLIGDYGSLFSIATGKEGAVLLVFLILSLVIGVASILVPVFYTISAMSMLGTFLLIMLNSAVYPSIGFSTILIVFVVTMIVIVLGMLASTFMNKYVRSNARNVTMFQCSLMTWFGFRSKGVVQ